MTTDANRRADAWKQLAKNQRKELKWFDGILTAYDNAENARLAYRESLFHLSADLKAAYENLTACQTRCGELLEENRELRKALENVAVNGL